MSKVMLYGKRTLDFMCLLISHSSGDVAHQLMTLGFLLLLPLLSFSWCNKAPAPAPAGLASQLDAPVPVMGVTQSWPDGTTPKTNLSPACASPAHDQRGYNIIFKTCPALSCPGLILSRLLFRSFVQFQRRSHFAATATLLLSQIKSFAVYLNNHNLPSHRIASRLVIPYEN